MFAGCLVSLVLPFLIWCVMRPFVRDAYDWDLLFYMVPREPRVGDVSFTSEDDNSLGLDWDPKELARAAFIAKSISTVLCLIFLVIIPFPMYGAGYIMSKKFFTGWTVIVFIWSWVAALLIWCLPVWQSRGPLGKVMKGIWEDVIGGRKDDMVEESIDGTVVESTEGVGKVKGDEKLHG